MNIFYKYLLKGRGAEFRVLRIESDPVVEARPASCRTGVASGKRQVVVVAREVRGRTLPFIVSRESDAVPLIRQHVASGTIIHADESNAWERLHASYDTRRVTAAALRHPKSAIWAGYWQRAAA